MKAVVAYGSGRVEVAEVEKPVPGPKEVLVKVHYSGICGTDVEISNGATSLTRDSWLNYPVRIGHEWSGIVEAVGSEVTDFKPGDRVISDTDYTCGTCEACLSGNHQKCKRLRSLGTVGNFKDGAHAEYIVNHHWHLHKIPDSMPLDEAVLVEPATIAYNALLDCTPKPEQTILIVGTGAIGLMAVYLAKYKGLRVLLAGRKPMKLELGKQLGADAVVNLTQESLEDFVKEQTNGFGVDIFYETTGVEDFLSRAVHMTRYRGTIATVAFYNGYPKDFNVNKMVLEHIRLLGLEGASWHTVEVMDIMANSGISFKPLLTHRVKLIDAAEAIRNIKQDSANKIKVLIEMQ